MCTLGPNEASLLKGSHSVACHHSTYISFRLNVGRITNVHNLNSINQNKHEC